MSDCLFCKIRDGKIPAKPVHDDEHALAFRDINPQAPTHILIIPRRHIASLKDVTADDQPLLGHLLLVASRLAASEGIAEAGYRTVFNAGGHGGQTVHHLHLHLLGGRPLGWPPG